MKLHPWMITIGVLCAHTIMPHMEYELYQLHSAISHLEEHIQPNVDIPRRIYQHLHEHKYISWDSAFPDINFESDILPQLADIKKTTRNFISNIASHDYELSLIKELQSRNIITESRNITPSYGNIIKKLGIDRGAPWWIFPLQHTSAQTSYTSGNISTISELISSDKVPGTASHRELYNAVQTAQNTYKIHIMPYTKDLVDTVSRILDAYSRLSAEQQYIRAFKFSPNIILQLDRTIPSTNEHVGELLPRIVIYPLENKHAAEKTLHWLLQLFYNQPGLGIYPRFNHRVTSLIYYSQGNADDRYEPSSSYIFDPNTGYTFINTDAIKQAAQRAGISTENLGLHTTQQLIHPDTGKPF